MSITAHEDWTLLGAAVLDEAGLRPGTDAVCLARRLGLTTVPRPGPGYELRGVQLRYDESAQGMARQRLIGRCLARWALRVAGLPPSDLAEHVIMRCWGLGRSALRPAVARG